MAISKKIPSPLTIEEVKELYRTYNRRAFDGILPDNIPFSFTSRISCGGRCLYTIGYSGPKLRLDPYRNAFYVHGSLKIELGVHKSSTKESMTKILLHEMIHAYFAIKEEFGVDHGGKFIEMCKTVERITGIVVPLREDATIEDHEFHDTPQGVYVVDRGNRISFATVSAKSAKSFVAAGPESEDRIAITKYDDRLPVKPKRKLYLSNSRMTQEKSVGMATQRKMGYKTKLFSFRSPETATEWLADLAETGELILEF